MQAEMGQTVERVSSAKLALTKISPASTATDLPNHVQDAQTRIQTQDLRVIRLLIASVTLGTREQMVGARRAAQENTRKRV